MENEENIDAADAVLASNEGGSDERPNLYDEAHDMTVVACATHFLGRMRLLAREETAGQDITNDRGSANSKSRAFSAETAATLLSTPITPREIADAMDARGDEVSFLDGEADFGRKQWAEVNKDMLRSSLRDTVRLRDHPAQTWEIVEYSDERSEKELVYAIAVDDVQKRVVVGFRASVTAKDWRTNCNVVYGKTTNPVADMHIGEGGIEQPKKIVMHRGFRNYLFQEEGKEDDESDESDFGKEKKIHTILKGVAKALEDRPGYALYTTGYSLGAALATVFAFYAAASDDSGIPKPVTCVNIGSPKCGTLSFRKAFASLELSGKLRCLRIMNENDPIKEAPFTSLDARASFVPGLEYRHVGIALYLRQGGGYSLSYPRLTRSYWRLLWDDWYHKDLMWRASCNLCCDHLCGRAAASEIGDHHGYSEYMHRLETNRAGLRKLDLDRLYREAREGTVPCLCCPCSFPQDLYSGEIRLHYY